MSSVSSCHPTLTKFSKTLHILQDELKFFSVPENTPTFLSKCSSPPRAHLEPHVPATLNGLPSHHHTHNLQLPAPHCLLSTSCLSWNVLSSLSYLVNLHSPFKLTCLLHCEIFPEDLPLVLDATHKLPTVAYDGLELELLVACVLFLPVPLVPSAMPGT